MQKTLIKIATTFTVIMLVVLPILSVSAATLDPWGGGDSTITEATLGNSTGLGNSDPRTIAARVINIALGFLGIIAVVIILLGGFKWMTTGGNEEKVEEAQKLIKSGIIGLIIILAAWGIASFVVDAIVTGTGASTGGTGAAEALPIE